MKISSKNIAVIKAANREIFQKKLTTAHQTNNVYCQQDIICKCEKVYTGFFHKMIVKIKLYFCKDRENFLEFSKNTKFLLQLDEAIEEIKADKSKERSLILSSYDDKYKSDVLCHFKGIFNNYKPCRISAEDGFLNIYFKKTDGTKEEFFLNVFVEISTEGPDGSTTTSTEYETVMTSQEYAKCDEQVVKTVKDHEMIKIDGSDALEILKTSELSIVNLRNEIDRYSFLKTEVAQKIVFLLNIFARAHIHSYFDKYEIFDAIRILSRMQSNIFEIKVEPLIFYDIARKYKLDPFRKVKLKVLLLLILKDEETKMQVKQFIENPHEAYLYKP